MSNYETCPNCGKAIKPDGFRSNPIINGASAEYINTLVGKASPAFCKSCSKDLLFEADSNFEKITKDKKAYINKNIHRIPIITSHSPYGWQYDSLSIVSGQVVVGTGPLSEFTSSFTDFFGGNSNSFSKKLAQGEQDCFEQLRAKAVHLGGNAIIATDIDYGEVGAATKGMLMVCAAGTAVKVKNTDVLKEDVTVFETITQYSSEIRSLTHLKENMERGN
ncbi:YbjQ family protein [Plebeiibacterium sediminum]|uniref:YbjQ family protein n=1 Tax=Plebeiibacterium sediminum TaxID=2992112 RepID=A0AAE3SDB4_9BACT|nr:heavy metal-binding domain-containing protein [Plebeiobacterium sediminum]MCW3784950.1 YbjQ family protein [Plebeiobacterium sediminum]